MLQLSKRYSKKYRNNKRAFINLIKINAKQFDKLEFIEQIDKKLEVCNEKFIISCRYVWMSKSL